MFKKLLILKIVVIDFKLDIKKREAYIIYVFDCMLIFYNFIFVSHFCFVCAFETWHLSFKVFYR